MKTKVLLCCFVAALLCTQLYAQQFINKQTSFGSPDVLDRIDIRKTVDGGFVMCKVAFIGFNTNDNYYLIKFDSTGRKQKELTLGGDGNDGSFSVIPTQDHGYLVAGLSNSGISGDKTEANLGIGNDFWIVKLDSLGRKQWDKTLGTPYNESGMVSVDTTLDGGYVLGGTSGGMWVAKLDKNGNLLWQKTVTGAIDDNLEKVYHTSDGGFIAGGNRSSRYSHSFNENYLVAKLDASGNMVWQRELSGSAKGDYDDGLYDVIETADGGYLAGGGSGSGVGIDKTDANTARQNIWIVKLDVNGNKLWDKTLGGDVGEDLCSLANTTDGGFVVATSSASNIAGEKTELSRGNSDYWIVKLTNTGQVQWDKTIGGSAEDDCSKIIENRKNEFVLGGTSESGISGDRTVPNKTSYYDFWVVGLKYKPHADTAIAANLFGAKSINPVISNTFKIYPNPVNDIIHIQAKGNNSYKLVNAAGKTILSKIVDGNGEINVLQLPAGVYYLQNETAHTSTKVVVTH